MQSMFPQLFCSVGLGFHTLDLMSGKHKGQCLLQASEKKGTVLFSFLCWVADSKLQSCLPQHFLLISTAIPPCNLGLLSMEYKGNKTHFLYVLTLDGHRYSYSPCKWLSFEVWIFV